MNEHRPPTGTSTVPSGPRTSLRLPSLGDTIEVWWDGDKVYYTGIVHSYNRPNNTFCVKYIDGDVDEAINLSTVKWRMVKPKSAGGIRPATPAAHRATPISMQRTMLPISHNISNPTNGLVTAVPTVMRLQKKPAHQSASGSVRQSLSIDVEKVSTPHLSSRTADFPGTKHKSNLMPQKQFFEAQKRTRSTFAGTPAGGGSWKSDKRARIFPPGSNENPMLPNKKKAVPQSTTSAPEILRRNMEEKHPYHGTSKGLVPLPPIPTGGITKEARKRVPVPTMNRMLPTKQTAIGTMSALATSAARTVCSAALLPVKSDIDALKRKTIECINKNGKICDLIGTLIVKQDKVADENKRIAREVAKSEMEKSKDVKKYVKGYLDEYLHAHKQETTKIKNRIDKLEQELLKKKKFVNASLNSTLQLMVAEMENARKLVQTEMMKNKNVGDVEEIVKKLIMPRLEKVLVNFLKNETTRSDAVGEQDRRRL